LTPSNGIVIIYLSNEGEDQRNVYFDDLSVTLNEHPIVQTDDYYPFGLEFNSYRRVTSTPNDYLYNGKEKQDELGLDWLDYGARMYDPAIGRWHVVDPLADSSVFMNPYHYVRNNPILRIDPDGRLDVYVYGNDAAAATDALNNEHQNIEISRNASGKLSYTGEARTDAEKAIVQAINDEDVMVVLDTDQKSTTITSNGQDGLSSGNYEAPVVGGKWNGTRASKLGGIIASQGINMESASKMEKGGLGTAGETVTHELLEGYYSGL